MKKRLLHLTTFGIALTIAFVILSSSVAGAASGGGPGGGPGGSISGTVTNSSGGPVAGIYISVYTDSGTAVGTGQTDAGGNYQTTGISPGNYKVKFEEVSTYQPHYLSQYFNNKPDLASGDYVTVSDGQYTTGIDAILQYNPYWCSEPQPSLSYSPGPVSRGAFWASYADYLARNLTVDYLLGDGYPPSGNVTITGVANTEGVTLITPLPVFIGSIGTKMFPVSDVSLDYHLPAGVNSFTSTIDYTAVPGSCYVWTVYSYESINTVAVTDTVQGPIPLSLNKEKVYWQSYADYEARDLSVDYNADNQSGVIVHAVTIQGSTATNGVAASSSFPVALGDLANGSSAGFTIRYQIPVGTNFFVAGVWGTARDGFYNSFSLP